MPGMGVTTGMEREVSWEGGPMPEWRRRRGVSIAPAQRMVSRRAVRIKVVPDWRVMFTPVTVESVTLTRLTQASVRMVRLGLGSSPRRMGWMYATLALDLRPSSGLYATEKNPTPDSRFPLAAISRLKSWITGIDKAVEQDSTQSLQSWLRWREWTGCTVLRMLSRSRLKVSKDQPVQPRDSQMAVSWAKGRKEMRVLWEEQPPRTLARE